jgi:hypothetical protein
LFVHYFINEWISAPYPAHQRDRVSIVDGTSVDGRGIIATLRQAVRQDLHATATCDL